MRRVKIAMHSFQRETENGYCYATGWFLRRFYYRFLKHRLQPHRQPDPEDLKRVLTVIVPAVEKDASVLPHCLQSIRAMIRHQISEVWVVAPESVTIRNLAAAENCKFVLEDTILPRPAAELKCRGWVLQQFIKFNASAFVTTPDYLVVDADTVFLRPPKFLSGRQIHPALFGSIRIALQPLIRIGLRPSAPVSRLICDPPHAVQFRLGERTVASD